MSTSYAESMDESNFRIPPDMTLSSAVWLMRVGGLSLTRVMLMFTTSMVSILTSPATEGTAVTPN